MSSFDVVSGPHYEKLRGRKSNLQAILALTVQLSIFVCRSDGALQNRTTPQSIELYFFLLG